MTINCYGYFLYIFLPWKSKWLLNVTSGLVRYFEKKKKKNQLKDNYVTNKMHWFLVEQSSTNLKKHAY